MPGTEEPRSSDGPLSADYTYPAMTIQSLARSQRTAEKIERKWRHFTVNRVEAEVPVGRDGQEIKSRQAVIHEYRHAIIQSCCCEMVSGNCNEHEDCVRACVHACVCVSIDRSRSLFVTCLISMLKLL